MEMVICRFHMRMCQHPFPYGDSVWNSGSHGTYHFLAPDRVILKSQVCTYVDSTMGISICQKDNNGTIRYDSSASMQGGGISASF